MKQITSVKDLNTQVKRLANPGSASSAPTMLSMLKQAKDKRTGGVTSPVPDFFNRYMEIKAEGLDDIKPPKLKGVQW